MKLKMRFFLPLFLLNLVFLTSLYAQELAPQGTPQRKFQRGLINLAFAPVEISHELEKVKKQDEWMPTWVLTTVKGSMWAAVRVVTGIYDIVTFAIPSPPDYRVAYKPEFALEHIGLLKQE